MNNLENYLLPAFLSLATCSLNAVAGPATTAALLREQAENGRTELPKNGEKLTAIPVETEFKKKAQEELDKDRRIREQQQTNKSKASDQ